MQGAYKCFVFNLLILSLIFSENLFAQDIKGTGAEGSATDLGDDVPQTNVPGLAQASIRDPFMRPKLEKEQRIFTTELESALIDDVKLVGIITGLKDTKAILETPGGSTFVVGVNTRVGQNKGIITRITENSITVREKILNVMGQEEPVETKLEIAVDLAPSGAKPPTEGANLSVDYRPGGYEEQIERSVVPAQQKMKSTDIDKEPENDF